MNSGKRKVRNRILAAAIATVTAAGVLAGTLFSDVEKAYAKVTLRGIENIVKAHSTVDKDGNPDPFVILEVVPSLEEASLGYLIGGEEPLHEGRSIKAMPSKMERELYLKRFKEKMNEYNSVADPSSYSEDKLYQLVRNGALGWSDYQENPKNLSPLPEGSKTIEVRGEFKPAIEVKKEDGTSTKGWYNQNDYSDAFRIYGTYDGEKDITDLYDENNINHYEIFRKTEAFRTKDEFYKGGYSLSISRLKDSAEMPVNTSKDDKGYSVYNWQYFSATMVTDPSQLRNGDYIYYCDKDSSGQYLSYFGQIKQDDSGVLRLYVCSTDGEKLVDTGNKAYQDYEDMAADDDVNNNEEEMEMSDDGERETESDSSSYDTSKVISDFETDSKKSVFDYADNRLIFEEGNVLSELAINDSDTIIIDVGGENDNEMHMDDDLATNAPAGIIDLGNMVGDGRERDYYIVTETNSADAANYRIQEVRENVNAPYGRKQGYSQVLGETFNSSNANLSKGPYYVKLTDADEYLFAESHNGDFDFYKDYSKSIYNTFSYRGGISNNEWFKQYVFDRNFSSDDTSECDNLCVEVIPVTLDNIGDYIDKARLVYFAGGRYSDRKDLSAENARKLLDRVVDDSLAVIIERSALLSNIYISEEQPELVNLTLLLLELMQDKVTSVTKEDWDKITQDMQTRRAFEVIVNKVDPVTGVAYDVADISEKRIVDEPASYIDESTNSVIYQLDSGVISRDSISVYRSDLLKSMFYPYRTGLDVSFVHKTIFMNDDWNDEWVNGDNTKGKRIATASVVWSDFNNSYTEAKIDGNSDFSGFKEMEEEYTNERPIIENSGKWEEFNSAISKATCIRYIINANQGRYKVKNELRILDIEPFESDQYTEEELGKNIYYKAEEKTETTYKLTRDNIDDEWVKTNLDIDFDKEKSKINVKQMGMREFIGKNDDLNATYDMIYIGMDTALMNTEIKDGKKTTDTVYNESGMDGIVYTHMGEILDYRFWADWGMYRMSGIDITSDKYKQLSEYIKAGCALLLSDDFFKYDEKGNVKFEDDGRLVINTDKVDKSSNLYKLLNQVAFSRKDNGDFKYWGKNVFRKGALETTSNGYASARKVFATYVNVSKLNIKVIEQPIAYNDTEKNTTGNYLKIKPDGTYSLDYVVELSNDAALDSSDVTYDCKLYLDLDADGKFEANEEQGALVINDGSESISDGKFHLTAGNTYKITRNVPDEYIGFLSWKLSFVENKTQSDENNTNNEDSGEDSSDAALNGAMKEDISVRSAITGFSAVPVPTNVQPPTIKVIQITPNDKNGAKWNNLDLSSPEMQTLYEKVKDFEIDVFTITCNDYMKKNDNAHRASTMSYFDYLCQFDMLVIGFDDYFDYRIVGDAADVFDYRTGQTVNRTKNELAQESTLAIREYALSGRSILFTHDLTNTHVNDVGFQGHYADRYLRDVMGMDRYNRLKLGEVKYAYDRDATIKEYKSVYDTPMLKGDNTGDNSALTDAMLLRFWHHDNPLDYGITTRKITASFDINDKTVPKDGENKETVSAVNEGQITQYPFLITEGTSGDSDRSSFDVSMTHTQYFQLNLDTDSYDNNVNDDVVVWYTISNKDDRTDFLHPYYKAIFNDVRNNYYIYSKGNVTYTGSGHSSVKSELEKKLFVNTLVASYNSGLHAPRVKFKSNPWDSSADVDMMHLPYDVSMIKLNQAASDSEVVVKDGVGAGDFANADSKSGDNDAKFVVNFKTLNNNFRESLASLNVKYYIETESGGDLVVAGKGYKEITPTDCKLIESVTADELNMSELPSVSATELKNYSIYQLKFKISDLNLGGNAGLLPEDKTSLFVQIGTEDLSTGEVDALKATESINELKIYTAKLFDLE